MDPNAAAEQLLQNQKFVELFQRALGAGGKDGDDSANLLASMPKEGDPKREEWLRNLQARLQEETMRETKKDLEQVHSDENGQWMFVLPEPGFCIKTNVAGGLKVFINVCQHPRIAEPVPMAASADGSKSGTDEEQRYRIPISCGQARPEKDKSGKACKVYDVIVNPSTIRRCGEDNEFRRFVAALCMQWIKQKSEPTLNADEFRNLNFKCKGKLEPQRIRLSTAPKASNAMGDEIQLPSVAGAATAPSQVNGAQGTGQLIQELEKAEESSGVPPPSAGTHNNKNSSNSTDTGANGTSTSNGAATATVAPSPCVQKVAAEGSYDWTAHKKAALNPYFKESVPAQYVVTVLLPGISTIREVDVRVDRRQVKFYYIDEMMADGEEEGGSTDAALPSASPFLTATVDYPVSEDVVEAKYVRKTNTLRLRLRVCLPDETLQPATKPERDVTEVEEEEQRRALEARERQWAAAKAQRERQAQEETSIMDERRSYVENLTAVQSGDVPPVVRDEVDQMPRDQLPAMLLRLESRTRKGDSVDVLLEKLPEPMIEALIDYIREKLSLAPRPKKPAATAAMNTKAEAVREEGQAEANATNVPAVKDEEASAPPMHEFNAAKQSEALFGVAFHNRYLFALD